ncbi:rhodanese-like domain-containing protein [Parvibaculum sp.]|uniref:rhodanese-like domain-containing protein n=1 Tax=Parvibaculum sp. TaxID=2024848 RepID=UPI001DB89589|nr:rhodanese-like domain-containing protein [Parvibaculum sp.]MBX3489870.1 rhodanese-like domain-containing protein [Parvibaculum sp.]MCW5726142.1 rhodanese-like domain-containing protein [Parvibaculum sp.]
MASGGVVPEVIGKQPDDYAGDVTPEEAFRVLGADPNATLVDVRTRAEWSFVGLPDLSGMGKEPMLLEWQVFPAMERNPRFADDLASALGPDKKDVPVFFLCRSGARSRAAAIALTAAGFGRCFNIAGGFEGDLDSARHRGGRNGWKATGLPWAQS